MADLGSANRISSTLEAARRDGRLALVMYLTVGFPSVAATCEVGAALVEAGVDAIELGVPFSDPLADGPTIQAAATRALAQGVTTEVCLQVGADLRKAGPSVPLLFMGYYNPIVQYGPEAFVVASRDAGVDGLIVPDLPLEEAEELDRPCRERGIGIVPLVAPTTPVERIARQQARGAAFIYVTTRLGVTGARDSLPSGVGDLVQRVRSTGPSPVAVGFGISRPEQIAALRGVADAAIVGSALIDLVANSEAPAEAAARFSRGLLRETRPRQSA